MRKIAIILLAMCLVLSMAACAAKEQPLEPVSFYYCKAELSYDGADSLIASEQRESAGRRLETLLEEYFSGPEAPQFLETFPADTALVSFSQDDSGVLIVLSDPFAKLTGMELTIACCCITMTVMELTGAPAVTVRAQTAMLDSMPQITMDKNTLLLVDQSAAAQE